MRHRERPQTRWRATAIEHGGTEEFGVMNNSQQPTELQDQTLFSVDAVIFRQFCELLDAPDKSNPGLKRLMALTPPWSATTGIEDANEAK